MPVRAISQPQASARKDLYAAGEIPPLGHVPGSVLIEAFRQTAIAAACAAHSLPPERALVADYSAEYSRLGELGARIRCVATVGPIERGTPDDPVTVDLTLEQFGTSISDARVVLTFPDV